MNKFYQIYFTFEHYDISFKNENLCDTQLLYLLIHEYVSVLAVYSILRYSILF